MVDLSIATLNVANYQRVSKYHQIRNHSTNSDIWSIPRLTPLLRINSDAIDHLRPSFSSTRPIHQKGADYPSISKYQIHIDETATILFFWAEIMNISHRITIKSPSRLAVFSFSQAKSQRSHPHPALLVGCGEEMALLSGLEDSMPSPGGLMVSSRDTS